MSKKLSGLQLELEQAQQSANHGQLEKARMEGQLVELHSQLAEAMKRDTGEGDDVSDLHGLCQDLQADKVSMHL
jgi:hypothetical protein